MEILTTKQEMIRWRKENDHYQIGFVPTMGALHTGHMSLVEVCGEECEKKVVSIFVNPLQFNNKTDFEKYPDTPQEDLELLRTVGVDAVFVPSQEDLYKSPPTNTFDFGTLTQSMEAVYRPGHFEGVANIIKILFEIVQPTKAYFGEKDFQQLLIIKHIVQQLFPETKVIAVPTVRETNGLALSSRNKRLSATAKQKTPIIYQTLQWAKQQLQERKPITKIEETAKQKIEEVGFKVEYFTIADRNTLLTPQGDNQKIIATAVYAEDVRLIDNILC